MNIIGMDYLSHIEKLVSHIISIQVMAQLFQCYGISLDIAISHIMNSIGFSSLPYIFPGLHFAKIRSHPIN